ncbi:MAG: MFS transporter [candidate division Zixibacteria bacterium]|nr:MFS transporter [candidate division Zixibacteria bacterium]
MIQNLAGRFGALDKRVYILSLGWVVSSAGFAMVIPFLSIYFHEQLGLSMSAIGLFFGFTTVLRALPQPVSGWLSDRIGRVPIMGWSQILRSLTFAGVGYAIMTGSGFLVIAAFVSFNYIFGAVLNPAANAMVADLVAKEQRVSAYAMLRIGGNLGWALGPALGGFVSDKSYSALFYLAGFLMLISGVYFFYALKDVPRKNGQRGLADFKWGDILNLRQDPRLLRHCLISFALFLVVAQLIAALSVYCVETVGISRAQLGTLYAINGFMVVFLQFPVSSFFKRITLTGQLTVGAMIYAVGYFLVGLAPGFGFLILCIVIITIAEMIVSPPAIALVANLSPPEAYGRYMGIFGFFHMSGWSLGPTLGGFLLDIFATKPVLMWASISVLAVGASILYHNFGRMLTPAQNSALRAGVE